ncbi:MAG: hypothetical protein R6V58_03355 [Planctomycetota bacterium]
MRRIAAVLIGVAAAVLAPLPARGRASIEATITDTFEFKLRVKRLALSRKADPARKVPAMSLDHIPLTADGKSINLWLAQIKTATFEAAGGGRVEVAAVLQGEGARVSGEVADSARYVFEGRLAGPKGKGRGRRARVPLPEANMLTVHTEYKGVISTVAAGTLDPPMPGPDQDVLWVCSMPPGADVWAKAFKGPAAKTWPEYRWLGKAPLTQQVPAGTYAVKVLVPPKLARRLRPATKLGKDASPFENDWGEPEFHQGQNVLSSVVYRVVKTEGKAATFIALFQKKGEPLSEVVKGYPPGRNFNYDAARARTMLERQGIPEDDIELILEALARGGKIIWRGKARSAMFTVMPGGGVRLDGVDPPKEK